MTAQELHAYCLDWREWCLTRRYFIRPGTKNILARMQPSRTTAEPNAVFSDEMSFFNMAVHALTEMNDPDAECFIRFYWDKMKNVKVIAAKLGVNRVTFYDRKNRFAKRAYSMAGSLKRAHENLTQSHEKEEEAVD